MISMCLDCGATAIRGFPIAHKSNCPSLKFQQANPEHEIAYQDICALVTRHADKLSPLDLLAVAANFVGKLLAMQDHRKISPAEAMDVIAKNIEHGNQQVLAKLAESEGNS